MATKKKVATKTVAAKPVLPRGGQTIFTQAIADSICAQLAEGKSLNSICKQPGMPSEVTVRGWAMDNVQGFGANYARSREIGYAMLAEQIMEIADTPVIGVKTVNKATGVETTEGDMIEHRRLQVDARKWILSKMLPKVYGDKLQTEHSGSVTLFNSDQAKQMAALLNG